MYSRVQFERQLSNPTLAFRHLAFKHLVIKNSTTMATSLVIRTFETTDSDTKMITDAGAQSPVRTKKTALLVPPNAPDRRKPSAQYPRKVVFAVEQAPVQTEQA